MSPRLAALAYRTFRAAPVVAALQPLGAAWVAAQDVGVPPPATNLQPQILAPTPVNPTPPPIAPSGIPQGDFFTLGKPLAPLGDALANVGIYFKGFFASTLYYNVSGGVQQGTIGYNDAFYGFDVDLQKMAGLTGSVIHFSLDSRFGGIPQGVNDFSGSAGGFLQGAGPNNLTRLNELTLEQRLFDERVRVIVGRTTLASYFATSELYCTFQVGICSNIGPYTWSLNTNVPFWPISVWSGAISVLPTKNTYIRVGASEDDVFQFFYPGFPWNGGWSTEHATGVTVPVELGYATEAAETRYPEKYDIGFYYNSTNFPDPRFNTAGLPLATAGGVPASDGSRTGIYVQAQKMVWRPDPAKPQGLWLFGAASFSTSGQAPVQSYYMAGLVEHGTLSSRPNDTFGLMWAYYVWNPRFVDALNDRIAANGLVGTLPGTENIVQASYGFELAPGIQVKPYAAITFNPDQQLFDVTPRPGIKTSFAVGAVFSVLLNDALGLPSFFRPF